MFGFIRKGTKPSENDVCLPRVLNECVLFAVDSLLVFAKASNTIIIGQIEV